jgi:hypothetical protein
MARFYFHLRDHVDQTLDPEGMDLADLDAVKASAMAAARDVMAGDLRMGMLDLRYRIDVEDASGAIVFSLPFQHAVNIIPG